MHIDQPNNLSLFPRTDPKHLAVTQDLAFHDANLGMTLVEPLPDKGAGPELYDATNAQQISLNDFHGISLNYGGSKNPISPPSDLIDDQNPQQIVNQIVEHTTAGLFLLFLNDYLSHDLDYNFNVLNVYL